MNLIVKVRNKKLVFVVKFMFYEFFKIPSSQKVPSFNIYIQMNN